MYKGLTEKAIKTIYKSNALTVTNIYIDNVLLNPKYLLDFKH